MKTYFVTAILSVFLTGGPHLASTGYSSRTDLTVNSEWSIQVKPGSPTALLKAAQDLSTFLQSRHSLNLEINEQGGSKGIALVISETRDKDGFSLQADPSSEMLIVEGANGRAVYQGVLVLEDLLENELSLPENFEQHVEFPFRERYVLWDCLMTGQNKGAIGFDLESHVREAVRLGYTGMECNRFIGMELLQQGHPLDPYPWYTYWGPSMDQFVSSPLFDGVFPAEYLERNLSDLKTVVDVVKSFGLKAIFMGYEPRYVPEEFLQKHPKLRGPRVDHPLRSMANRYSLCTDQPEAQQHYRTLARNLAREIPALDEMWVIFHDSGTGFCWSHSLYSGRNGPEHCQTIPLGDRFKTFFSAVREGLLEGGLDIPLVAQPHGSSRIELDEFFENVPPSIELTAGNWASWSLAYRDPLGVDRYVLSRQRDTGRRALYYQQHFFGFNGAPTTEYPVPYILVQRLKRTLDLDLTALNTLGGFVSPPIKQRSAMQEVYRGFLLEPSLPEEELVVKVAARLGGEAGGNLLVTIWKDIHQALEENGRQLGFALGTEYTSRRTLVRPLVPESSALSAEDADFGMVLLPQETTWGYSSNLPDLLRRKIAVMERHLPEAEALFKRWFNSEY